MGEGHPVASPAFVSSPQKPKSTAHSSFPLEGGMEYGPEVGSLVGPLLQERP